MFGWSRGFVVFRTIVYWGEDHRTLTVVPYTSPDGLTWTEGQPLDVAGLYPELKMLGIADGPSGMLAYGLSPKAGPCGPSPYDAMWRSTDGLSWRRVDNENHFTSIGGGSSGFVGLANDSTVWISGDGLAWRKTDLGAAAKDIEIVGVTAFAKGFVVAGAVPLPTDGWCQETKAPSLWWSRDGKAWSQEALSPAPTGERVWIQRMDDDAVLAISGEYGAPQTYRAWTSTDGRTWTLDPDSPVLNSVLLYSVQLTNGRYGLLVSAMDEENGQYPVGQGNLWGFQANLRLVALPQSGDVPPAELVNGDFAALGPTGLLVPNKDGTRFWLGAPTAD
ncbi:MAG: hypothetical protein ABSB75_06365 [Candidatus Limnocylindrales bacterium]